ncbi:putative electron transfer flavoprotein subunit beta [Cardiosporidium cionae]|uniref:Electron transfer flavoprotein subunit beta n=1 Tax=Cardiosporidium cionae TaxID=476202 RepID=A0ABQ7J4D0_9APIC|nr:putative electron transfer flavoprotein subunit beta [Cardiosporidium cionae]|eukprot:KAF8817963.1 putative electron transfer flavoprotein subunit beta [Cardiosporidium cionae]
MLGVVCIKRVVDYAVKIRVSRNKEYVDLNNVKMAMNPFCEIAVEEGIKLKERCILKNLLVVTVGDDRSQETLRQALAMGADSAVLLKTDLRSDRDLQPLGVAKLLKFIILREQAKLALLGKQAIDDDFNQTGQLLAGLLGWPQATFASKVSAGISPNSLEIEREIDEGSQVVEVSLPAVVTCDLRLNEPRYATLPNLMKASSSRCFMLLNLFSEIAKLLWLQAKKKPLEIIDVNSLGIDFIARLKTLSVEEPSRREAGKITHSVEELVERLRNESKLNV